MKNIDLEKITLKEYMDAADKLCGMMDDEDCENCPFAGGSLQCEKSIIEQETVMDVFEKLEGLEEKKNKKENISPYKRVERDSFDLCMDRKLRAGGCDGCKFQFFGGENCLLGLFKIMLGEVESWKNEQNAGN